MSDFNPFENTALNDEGLRNELRNLNMPVWNPQGENQEEVMAAMLAEIEETVARDGNKFLVVVGSETPDRIWRNSDAGKMTWGFSIGLHPEIIVQFPTASSLTRLLPIVAGVITDIQTGTCVPKGDFHFLLDAVEADGESYDLMLARVSDDAASHLAEYAYNRATKNGGKYLGYQLVWPDHKNRFPNTIEYEGFPQPNLTGRAY